MELLIYFCLYFFLVFVWRSLRVYWQTGKNPLVLPANDNAYGYVGRAFKIEAACVAVIVVLNAANPEATSWLGPIAALQGNFTNIAGWMLLAVSLCWLLIAQVNMGNSWRIGIDAKNTTALVSTGLFQLSRNPIFLAMRMNFLGLLLVLPNGVTLALLIAAEILMQVQVRLEEAHLLSLHGEAYARYTGQVRRWL